MRSKNTEKLAQTKVSADGSPPNSPVNFSIKELAARWGVSERYIFQLIHNRQLGHLALGRRRLIPRIEADRFAQQHFVRACDADAVAGRILGV